MQHGWVKSTFHGDKMCVRCWITDREAAALGKLDDCGGSADVTFANKAEIYPSTTVPCDFVLVKGPEIKKALRIAELWFEPWGAAKAAEWEALTDDAPFNPELALERIRDLLREAGVK